MQVDNLRPQDLEKAVDFFEKLKLENPEIRTQTFLSGFRDKFKRKDCMFKDRCKK